MRQLTRQNFKSKIKRRGTMYNKIKDSLTWKTTLEIYAQIGWKRSQKARKRHRKKVFAFLNSSKQIILGTSFAWLPLLGCYIAEIIINLVNKIR